MALDAASAEKKAWSRAMLTPLAAPARTISETDPVLALTTTLHVHSDYQGEQPPLSDSLERLALFEAA